MKQGVSITLIILLFVISGTYFLVNLSSFQSKMLTIRVWFPVEMDHKTYKQFGSAWVTPVI